MTPTTQAALVLGLLALLVLLLVGRRRARRAAETEATPTPSSVEQSGLVAEPELQVEADLEVEVEAEPESESEVEVEPESEPGPEQQARRRGLFRRRRPRSAEVVAAPETETPSDETPDQAELRALREQLRALEEVVQHQVADHPTAALARVEETAAEQSAAYLRQVSYVVRGLAAHTSEEEDPRRTLARVAAAVERLGVPNSMERPILPMTSELPSRPQPDALQNPSHLRDVAERTADEHRSPSVTDVFVGLETATAVEPQAREEQRDQPSVPAAPVAADPVTTVPSYSELAAAARYEETVVAVHDATAPMPAADVPAAYEPEVDAGIPAYQVADVVLPVPPPAAPQPSGRRGRLRKSR